MMRRLAALIFAVTLGTAAHAADDHVPGQIIVKFKPGASASALGFRSSSVKTFGGAARTERARLFSEAIRDYALIRLPEGMTVEEAIARYRNHPLLDYVGPNPRAKALATPNDTSFGAQWNFRNTGQVIGGTAGTADADIDATEAWDIETGASNQVIVAVLDSGIDYTHPDLAANMWTNAAEAAGTAGVDDDGNGIIDDIHGARFNRTSGNPTGDPMDDYFHGTHVAGIIGARTNNSAGVAGVAWTVKLMALKFLDSTGNGDVARAIEGIQYAVDQGAAVINNSWGTQVNDPALLAAVTAARSAGVIFTAAAGNDVNSSTVYYPAGYAEVIAVSATDNRDRNVPFNFGAHIDVGAPGRNIFSTTLSGSYTSFSGTSMATPHVTGVAALMKARNPSLTPAQVHSIVVNSVDVPADWNASYGVGRLNASNAVRAVSDVVSPTVSITSPADGAVVSGTIDVSAAAGDNAEVRRVVFYVDGIAVSTDTASPYTLSANTTLVQNGPHTLVVRAYDSAGNQASATVTVTFANGDTVAPAVTIIRPGNGATVGGTVQVDVTATDNVGVAGVAFLLDGALQQVDATLPYGLSFNALLVSEGTHTITARAVDAANNANEHSVVVTISHAPVDFTPPTITIDSPESGFRAAGTLVIHMSASDDTSVAKVETYIDDVLVDSDDSAPYAYVWQTDMWTAGVHAVKVKAYDPDGNVGGDEISVVVRGVAASLGLFEPRFNPARGESLAVPLSLTAPAKVTARIYDRFGAEIVTLVDSDLAPGAEIAWDGRNDNREMVASGTFILVIEIDGNRETRKVIVRK